MNSPSKTQGDIPAAIFVEILEADGAILAAFATRLFDVTAASFGQHAFANAGSAYVLVAALKDGNQRMSIKG